MATELTVKVPGKVMLCGEYGVLTSGTRALAFALDAYLEVYIRYGTTARDSLILHSNLWHAPRQVDAKTTRDNMLVDTVCKLMPSGEHTVEEIRVTSQLNPSYGFGSSSALRLALAYIAYLQKLGVNLTVPPVKRWQIAGQAFAMQKKSQQLASGYDVATQFVGGIVDYHSCSGEWPSYQDMQSMQALGYENLHGNLVNFVHIFIGGKGADTTTVMHDTKNWIDAQGNLPMITASNPLRHAFIDTLRNLSEGSLRNLSEAMAQWRKLFSTSPHFPRHIAQALQSISGQDRKWSWKTSGAGGEDALIVVGHKEDITAVTACLAELGWRRFDYNVSERGLQLQKI